VILRPPRLTASASAASLCLACRVARADTMPQLQFSNPLLVAQVIWGAIIFAAFYWLVSRRALPQVDAVLEKRAQTIGAELDAARQSKQAADRAVAELTQARKRAYAESQAAIADATAKAKQQAADRAAEVNARLDRQLAESEARIGEARRTAMESLQSLATGTAEAVFAKVTGLTPDAQRIGSAVSSVLGEPAGHAQHNTANLA
jgi:F-type H+-transporting ATPase subunit b